MKTTGVIWKSTGRKYKLALSMQSVYYDLMSLCSQLPNFKRPISIFVFFNRSTNPIHLKLVQIVWISIWFSEISSFHRAIRFGLFQYNVKLKCRDMEVTFSVLYFSLVFFAYFCFAFTIFMSICCLSDSFNCPIDFIIYDLNTKFFGRSS